MKKKIQPPFPLTELKGYVAYTLQFQGVGLTAGYPKVEP